MSDFHIYLKFATYNTLVSACYFDSSIFCALIKVSRNRKRVKREIKNRVITRFMQLNQAQQLVRSIFLRAVISRFKDCDRRDTHAQQYWFRDPLAVLPRFRIPRTKLRNEISQKRWCVKIYLEMKNDFFPETGKNLA